MTEKKHLDALTPRETVAELDKYIVFDKAQVDTVTTIDPLPSEP